MLGGRSSFYACVVLSLSLLGGCSSMAADMSKQLLRPPTPWLVEPADLGLRAEPFEIVLHSEASLTGWWIPHEDAAGRTVVLLHDEATNVSALHPYYTFLHDEGFQVLAFDPRGFGKSVGTPSLQAWLYDLEPVFDWLHARADVDKDKIALFGTSLGSVAAMWAARRHRECCAVVFEHLPSLRDMLRESTGDDGSALSAYTVGVLEFSGLPEDIEPSDNAPKAKVRALFIATENEPARDRLALLRAYEAYAGDKSLWIVPDAKRAPHPMLTEDAGYRRGISAFLHAAFAGAPAPIDASVRKVRDASDGEAWYEIQLDTRREADAEPWAVEACAVLTDGSPRFARTWIDGPRGRVRIKLPKAPTVVTATRVFDATSDDETVFARTPSHLSRSGAAVAHLWPRIEELRNDQMSVIDCQKLGAELRAAAANEPFHPTLEAELADVFAKIGLRLAGSTDPALAAAATGWLERALSAVPEHPERHFWPGPVPTYGFPYGDTIDEARRRLRTLTPKQ